MKRSLSRLSYISRLKNLCLGASVVTTPRRLGQTVETSVWAHSSSEPKLKLAVGGGRMVEPFVQIGSESSKIP